MSKRRTTSVGYTGTTDANGNYAINVKSNSQGVAAMITIDGFTGTQDTIINNVTKTGLYATVSQNIDNVSIDDDTIDVIIPVFNGAQTIEQTLESVFQQSYEYLGTIIIVNDGSTDELSIEILGSYKKTKIFYYK